MRCRTLLCCTRVPDPVTLLATPFNNYACLRRRHRLWYTSSMCGRRGRRVTSRTLFEMRCAPRLPDVSLPHARARPSIAHLATHVLCGAAGCGAREANTVDRADLPQQMQPSGNRPSGRGTSGRGASGRGASGHRASRQPSADRVCICRRRQEHGRATEHGPSARVWPSARVAARACTEQHRCNCRLCARLQLPSVRSSRTETSRHSSYRVRREPAV